MRLVNVTEHHFIKTPDGKIYSSTGGRDYTFWSRYLDVFHHVTVIARVEEKETISRNLFVANGKNVDFIELPEYTGGQQYLHQYYKIRNQIHSMELNNTAVILRVPSPIGGLIQNTMLKSGHPYGLEVVGDPYDAFAPGAVKHPLRPFFRWWFSRQLRQQCKKASAIAYVTEYALQRRYPPSPDAFSTFCSDIDLYDYDFVAEPRSFQGKDIGKLTLITVGTLRQLYKAPDVLIDAVDICVKTGIDLELIIVGDGKYRTILERQVEMLGLKDRVHFYGLLPAGDAVRVALDKADVFILPSRTEGLPRAVIEAMARGLPCISSTVGGIPELLPADDLVPPDDVNALARKIREVVTNPARMSQMSARNLEKAKQYRTDVLRERWVAFYQYVKAITMEWLKNGE